MGSIRVVSKRKGGVAPHPDETIIDVDRTNAVLGNPFYLADHNDEVQRKEVIARYAAKLEKDWSVGGPMSLSIRGIAAKAAAGERVALRCWCAPRNCHADLIKNLVVSLVPGLAEEVPAKKSSANQMALF